MGLLLNKPTSNFFGSLIELEVKLAFFMQKKKVTLKTIDISKDYRRLNFKVKQWQEKEVISKMSIKLANNEE